MRPYETYIFEAVCDTPYGDAVETYHNSNIWDALLTVARNHCGLPYNVRTFVEFKNFVGKDEVTYDDIVDYMKKNNENLLKFTNIVTGVTYFE